jgi:hypothetical protein
MRWVGLVGAVGMFWTTVVATAWGETSTTICVPEKPGKAVVAGTSEGTCTKPKYSAVVLPGAGGLATLNKLAPHLSYVEKGVAGKATIQFSGLNMQIVDGSGHTSSLNGSGNLVLGYDEHSGINREETVLQTGSHNLILGEEQEFTSTGGIVSGNSDSITAENASVIGGFRDMASGQESVVTAGTHNSAANEAAFVGGGYQARALGIRSSTVGGASPLAQGNGSSVVGGVSNTASGEEASIIGGINNLARARFSTISGGGDNHADGELAVTSGGEGNDAEAKWSAVFGGKEIDALIEYESRL